MYDDFASVYDEFMDETPYELWASRISNCIEKYGISKPVRDAADALESEANLVLDLGCGTGTFTEMLYDKGYDMIGADLSPEMLSVAMQKKMESGRDILYLNQDMRELDLYSTVGTVVSVCDSVNYILESEELEGVFRDVYKYLFPGGIFLFDFNTVHKYRDVIGDTTIAEDRDECSFIWENFYDEESRINEYDLTLFIREESGLYRKSVETHMQRGYEPEEIASMLRKCGFSIIAMTDADEMGENEFDLDEKGLTETSLHNSERVFVIAKKEG